jgi:2-haloacid dehalogenase
MNVNIKAIIWDLGNVFINWDPNRLFDRLITDDEKRQYFFEHVCTMDWNENQDAGYPIQQATAELAAKHPEWKEHIESYYGRWVEMLGGAIEGTVDIFRTLKETTNLKHYALTNWSHELFPTALEMFDFLHWFDGRVVSGEEKMRKPEPAFYQILLDRYRLQPTDVIFIDDNLRNVKAAETMGIRSIRFESPAQLRQDLIDLSLLPVH